MLFMISIYCYLHIIPSFLCNDPTPLAWNARQIMKIPPSWFTVETLYVLRMMSQTYRSFYMLYTVSSYGNKLTFLAPEDVRPVLKTPLLVVHSPLQAHFSVYLINQWFLHLSTSEQSNWTWPTFYCRNASLVKVNYSIHLFQNQRWLRRTHEPGCWYATGQPWVFFRMRVMIHSMPKTVCVVFH